jgi:hypothetical protein
MRYKKLTLDQALSLEERGDIEIYYPGGITKMDPFHDRAKTWADNFDQKAYKYRKVPLANLLDFININYVIDVLVKGDGETSSYTWIYLYAKDLQELYNQESKKGQYVYVLTNRAYPGICKIGKAVDPQSRVKAINGAGVLEEWDLRFMVPVVDDYRVEGYIHKIFSQFRVNSSKDNSREFFRVDYQDAKAALLGLAVDFSDGEPVEFKLDE